jgi:phosphopantetheinyl transferase
MPLQKMLHLDEHGAVAIWQIAETETTLAARAQETCPAELVSPIKRLEWLAGRLLLKHLIEQMGLTYHGVYKDEFGKPFLNKLPLHISLSHSYPFVAAQLQANHAVGIDLEQPKEKLLSIANRVLSADEERDAGVEVKKHCVYWCAKETMYKIYGRRALHFSTQLHVAPFTLEHAGILSGIIRATGGPQMVKMRYQVDSDYVLVYTTFE